MSWAAATLLLAAAPSSAERELVLDAASPFVEATIAGEVVRLRVDPGTSGYVTISPDAARRLRLKRSGRIVERVGRTVLRGAWARSELRLGAGAAPVRVRWFPEPADPVADGRVSPATLPVDVVRWVARPAAPGDRATRVPARAERWRGLHGAVTVGGDLVELQLAPDAPRSVATAAAGAVLAAALAGALTGPTEPTPVASGVARPVRLLRLRAPLVAAGFHFDGVLVRVSDWSGTRPGPPDGDLALDELLVTARREPQRFWAKLTIGADKLRACAEISYSRREAAFTLLCRP